MKEATPNQIEPKSGVLKVDDLEMDVDTHQVKRAGHQIPLNRKEFALLKLFMQKVGILLTRDCILHSVWDTDADPFTNTVDVHVRFLRRKIDEGHRKKLIKTVHGCGYKMEA